MKQNKGGKKGEGRENKRAREAMRARVTCLHPKSVGARDEVYDVRGTLEGERKGKRQVDSSDVAGAGWSTMGTRLVCTLREYFPLARVMNQNIRLKIHGIIESSIELKVFFFLAKSRNV